MGYYEDYVSGKITKEFFVEKKRELSLEEENLKLQLNLANDKLSKITVDVKKQQQAVADNKHLTKYKDIEKLTPELAKELISKITIFDNSVINIEWNFNNQLEPETYALEIKVS